MKLTIGYLLDVLSPFFFKKKGNNTAGGHIYVGEDSSYDLGTNTVRFRNIYADNIVSDSLTGTPAESETLVKINVDDAVADYLAGKITTSYPLSFTTRDSGGSNLYLDLSIDNSAYLLSDGTNTLTGNLSVSEGKTIDGVDISDLGDRTVEGGRGLTSNLTTLKDGNPILTIGAGDGITVLGDTIEVNANELVGAGISQLDNDFIVDTDYDFEWDGDHTFNHDIQVEANINFGGSYSITADDTYNLTLAPDNNLILVPGSGDTRIQGDVVFTGASRNIESSSTYDVTLGPGGNLRLDPGDGYYVVLDDSGSTKSAIKSDSYQSQNSGFIVRYDGTAEFMALRARELRVKVFTADVEQVVNSMFGVYQSSGVLSRDFEDGDTTIYLYDNEAMPDTAIFTDGDYVLIPMINRTDGGINITAAWGQVSTWVDSTVAGEQSWTFTRDTVIPGTFGDSVDDIVLAGGLVLDYGVAGDGFVRIVADDIVGDDISYTYAPFLHIATWATHPSLATDRVRLGNLNGLALDDVSGYGLYAMGTDSTEYLAATGTGVKLQNIDLSIKSGSTERVSISSSGELKLGTDVSDSATISFYSVASTGDTRLGPYASDKPNLLWDQDYEADSVEVGALRFRNYDTDIMRFEGNGHSWFTGVIELDSGGEIRRGYSADGDPVHLAAIPDDYTGVRVWSGTAQISNTSYSIYNRDSLLSTSETTDKIYLESSLGVPGYGTLDASGDFLIESEKISYASRSTDGTDYWVTGITRGVGGTIARSHFPRRLLYDTSVVQNGIISGYSDGKKKWGTHPQWSHLDVAYNDDEESLVWGHNEGLGILSVNENSFSSTGVPGGNVESYIGFSPGYGEGSFSGAIYGFYNIDDGGEDGNSGIKIVGANAFDDLGLGKISAGDDAPTIELGIEPVTENKKIQLNGWDSLWMTGNSNASVYVTSYEIGFYADATLTLDSDLGLSFSAPSIVLTDGSDNNQVLPRTNATDEDDVSGTDLGSTSKYFRTLYVRKIMGATTINEGESESLPSLYTDILYGSEDTGNLYIKPGIDATGKRVIIEGTNTGDGMDVEINGDLYVETHTSESGGGSLTTKHLNVSGKVNNGWSMTVILSHLTELWNAYDAGEFDPAFVESSDITNLPWSNLLFTGSSIADIVTVDHDLLDGLGDDDHVQYVHISTARTITAQHTFTPSSSQAPFVLGASAQDQKVTGLYADTADNLTRSISAGAGLSGGGVLSADRTLAVDSTVARSTWAVSAGNGLTGGGNLSSSGISFAVGAGTGISVAATTVGIDESASLTFTNLTLGDSGAPFAIASGSQGYTVVGLRAETLARSVVAGSGLSGGGALTADITLNVGAGDGINSTGSAIEVDGTVARDDWDIAAGSGLTGGGSLAEAGITINIGSGDGLTVNADSIEVNEDYAFDWTANHNFGGNITIGGHLYADLPDTSDIGSATVQFRQSFISQMNATIFAEYTQQVINSIFTVAQGSGTFPEQIDSTDEIIDFGVPMTVGDIIVIRAHDTGGDIKAEYISIDSLNTGTEYNVTRDLSDANATDPQWSAETVYVVLGHDGAGRIDIDNSSTPRISVKLQGDVYNSLTELIRLGDINGAFGISGETYGIAIAKDVTESTLADYEGLTFDPTNGLRIINSPISMYDTTQTVSITASGDVKFGSDISDAVTFEHVASSGLVRLGLSSGANVEFDGTSALTISEASLVVDDYFSVDGSSGVVKMGTDITAAATTFFEHNDGSVRIGPSTGANVLWNGSALSITGASFTVSDDFSISGSVVKMGTNVGAAATTFFEHNDGLVRIGPSTGANVLWSGSALSITSATLAVGNYFSVNGSGTDIGDVAIGSNVTNENTTAFFVDSSLSDLFIGKQNKGHLWWDQSDEQLKLYDGATDTVRGYIDTDGSMVFGSSTRYLNLSNVGMVLSPGGGWTDVDDGSSITWTSVGKIRGDTSPTGTSASLTVKADYYVNGGYLVLASAGANSDNSVSESIVLGGDKIDFYTNNEVKRMTLGSTGSLWVQNDIETGGDIGVGKTPSYALDVLSSNSIVAMFKSTDSSYGRIAIDGYTTGDHAYISFLENGSTVWSAGHLATDGKFSISYSSLLGTSRKFSLDSSGNGSFTGDLTAGGELDINGTGSSNIAGDLTVDTYSVIENVSSNATFRHSSMSADFTEIALRQNSSGDTVVNAKSGTALYLRVNNASGVGVKVDADKTYLYDPLVINGSDTITNNPLDAGSNAGWKASLYSTNYAIGVAANTIAVKSGTWLSLFDNTNPANDATDTTPDSHAAFAVSADYMYHLGALGEAWTSASMATGWSNYGGSWYSAQYKKFGDMIFLRGMVKCTNTSYSTIFTLPSGYYNGSYQSLFICRSNGGSDEFNRITINTSGQVVCDVQDDATTWLSLSGIVFSVA